MRCQEIKKAIEALRRTDGKLEYFGSASHGYRFNSPLSELQISTFENRHGIKLPNDYRCFLTELGDGGAGPSYGVFGLGKMDDNWEERTWTEGEFVGSLRSSWPHRRAWNLPREALSPPDDLPDAQIEAALEDIDKKYWDEALVAGAVPICHHGCALRDWLVVTGPEAGHVWHDARAEYGGMRPYENINGQRLTFEGWYLDWLVRALQHFGLAEVLQVPTHEDP